MNVFTGCVHSNAFFPIVFLFTYRTRWQFPHIRVSPVLFCPSLITTNTSVAVIVVTITTVILTGKCILRGDSISQKGKHAHPQTHTPSIQMPHASQCFRDSGGQLNVALQFRHKVVRSQLISMPLFLSQTREHCWMMAVHHKACQEKGLGICHRDHLLRRQLIREIYGVYVFF